MYNSKIIIALDFNSQDKALDFLGKFGDQKLFVKIGMELFYKEGPEIVTKIKELGHNVFLDLKLYDIPTTAAKAVESLGSLGVDMLTVHASGGYQMLELANQAASKYNLKLLGVTVLTSQTVSELPKTDYPLPQIIEDLASKSNNAGLYGIICSATDIPEIKFANNNLKYITPGIRLSGDAAHDQKRVMTPNLAIDNGADFLVIGRSITTSSNPQQKYQEIQQMIGEEYE